MSDDLKLSPADRLALYGVRRFIGSDLEEKLALRTKFDVYFQDPLVAARDTELAFDDECFVEWEPAIGDGPTSARFAIVDYDGHTEALAAPARWDARTRTFTDAGGNVIDRRYPDTAQFHQVNVWALLQRALDFFENGFGLGRRIPWGFDGSRLIVVPHAGIGRNAYYDRLSKSLQFYYFDEDNQRVCTCLSTDIVHHEFGHAVLDGLRPLYNESVMPETAAFHEFMGDLTAILISLRNTPFRQKLIRETGGDLNQESTLSAVAEQFGTFVTDRPYLRSARNPLKMDTVAGDQRPHHVSQVLTGAMFDILVQLSKYYVEKRGRSVPQAFWNTVQRMQSVAIQPLDLLPPVDVTFKDYALAVLRHDEFASPADPDNYRGMLLDAFIDRGILDRADRDELEKPHHVFERLDLDVFHDANAFAGSRADAYRFLDDNRKRLFIPPNADVTVVDLATSQKLTREARRLPRQIALQYVWREDVVLQGAQFGRFDGALTSLPCGATLSINQNNEVLSWARKPGSASTGTSEAARAEQERGRARLAAFLEALARRIKTGRVGQAIGGERGLLAGNTPPLTSRLVDGTVRFELSPHFGIHDDVDDPDGGRAWQISS